MFVAPPDIWDWSHPRGEPIGWQFLEVSPPCVCLQEWGVDEGVEVGRK